MKTVAIIAIIGALTALLYVWDKDFSTDVETQFHDFLSIHRVGYGSTKEYSFRLGIFAKNLETIKELNQANPEAVFAVNKFADRTQEEMQLRMGLIVPAHATEAIVRSVHKPAKAAVDQDFAYLWKDVKDQGSCGSCWAFSATAAFEARSELSAKHVDTLYAEQELVDCDTQSAGCNGGWMDNAFEYLKTHGFCTESQYPYKAVNQKCEFATNACSSGPSDKAYTDIPSQDEDALLAELANGPISVAVDASTWSFYKGGIMSSCGSGLNHGVTLVAFNNKDGSVTIRNSWGSSWGEAGYIRLKANVNICGYSNSASVPNF
jgi:C1A family cysteine protease